MTLGFCDVSRVLPNTVDTVKTNDIELWSLLFPKKFSQRIISKMSKIFFSFLLLLSVFSAYASSVNLPDGSIVVGPIVDGKLNGDCEQVFANGDKYRGQFKNGLRDGFGILETKIYKYEGDFKDGYIHGKGIYEFYNGDIYNGNTIRGYFEGDGVLKYNNGAIYMGSWRLGLKSGFGTIQFLNGEFFKGSFENDVYNGYGEYLFVDHSVYKGNYKNGIMRGDGVIILPNGSQYKIKDGDFSVIFNRNNFDFFLSFSISLNILLFASIIFILTRHRR